jgi:hypothetical protein
MHRENGVGERKGRAKRKGGGVEGERENEKEAERDRQLERDCQRERQDRERRTGTKTERWYDGQGLTAAELIRAVRAVGLLITLVARWDAGAVTEAHKLLWGTRVTWTSGGWNTRKR